MRAEAKMYNRSSFCTQECTADGERLLKKLHNRPVCTFGALYMPVNVQGETRWKEHQKVAQDEIARLRSGEIL